jgi:hypothetical protein
MVMKMGPLSEMSLIPCDSVILDPAELCSSCGEAIDLGGYADLCGSCADRAYGPEIETALDGESAGI